MEGEYQWFLLTKAVVFNTFNTAAAIVQQVIYKVALVDAYAAEPWVSEHNVTTISIEPIFSSTYSTPPHAKIAPDEIATCTESYR